MPRIKKDQFRDAEEPRDDDGPEPAEQEEEEGKVQELSTEPDPNEEPEGESDEAKTARKERRANRFKEAQELATEERKRREEAEQRANEAAARAAAAEQTARMVAEQARSWTQGAQQDPWQAAIENEVAPKRKALMAEHRDLVASGKYDAAEQARLAGEWSKLDIRQQEIVTHKALYYRDMEAQRNAPNLQAQANEAAFNSRMQSEFPDIMANRQHVDHMTATFFQLRAEGKPNDWTTAAAAAALTRRAFKLGTRPPPDAATKARYSGVGGGANGHTNGSSGKIPMLPKYKKMAEARYPDDPPATAHKKWAQTVGKAVMESDE